MALYEKRDDVYCGSCGHFTRHYIWRDGRQARNAPNGCFLPLSLGHCAHPRMKDRRELVRILGLEDHDVVGRLGGLVLAIPRTPDQDPPDTRLPGANAPDR